MTHLKSCIVVVVVAICFYSTSAIWLVGSKSGSAAGGAAGEVSGGNEGELNISIKFENKYVAKFVAALKASYRAYVIVITTLEENTEVASSSAFRLFVEPMNDFYGLFEEVVFMSVNQFVKTLIEGFGNLRTAIDNGWKLVYDLNSQGFEVYGAAVAGCVAGFEALFSFAQSLKVIVSATGGASGQGVVVGGGEATGAESVTYYE